MIGYFILGGGVVGVCGTGGVAPPPAGGRRSTSQCPPGGTRAPSLGIKPNQTSLAIIRKKYAAFFSQNYNGLVHMTVCAKHLRSPKFIWAPVYSCIHWLRPRNLPPSHLGSYTWTLLVSQDRRHLFVTSWCKASQLACHHC